MPQLAPWDVEGSGQTKKCGLKRLRGAEVARRIETSPLGSLNPLVAQRRFSHLFRRAGPRKGPGTPTSARRGIDHRRERFSRDADGTRARSFRHMVAEEV